MKKISLFLLILTLTLFSEVSDPLLAKIYETSSLYHLSLGGGGSAIPTAGFGQRLNPALFPIWHKIHQKRLSTSAMYTMSDEGGYNILGGAGSFLLNENSGVAGEYLYKKDDNNLHSMSLSYAGLAAYDKEAGELVCGANFSYYNHGDDVPVKDSLPISSVAKTFYHKDIGITNRSRKQTMVTTDLAFYQIAPASGVAYSLVFENILGYSWKTFSPALESHERIDSVALETGQKIPIEQDSLAYGSSDSEEEHKEWLSAKYKTVLMGAAFSRPVGAMNLIIPIDFRFWGLMNGDMRKDFFTYIDKMTEVRTGFELQISDKLSARFGYSWATKELTTDSDGEILLDPTHSYSGGASLSLDPVTVDVAIIEDGWGISATLGF